MLVSDIIATISKSFYDCMHNQVKEISYQQIDYVKKRDTGIEEYVDKVRPASERDIELYSVFIQTWGSTSLGFGGIGGAAMTDAYTTIYLHDRNFYVYFGGYFAYAIESPNEMFYNDIKDRNMKSVKECKQYE